MGNEEAMYAEQYRIERIELAYTKNHCRFIEDIELPVDLISTNIDVIRTIGEEYGISDADIEEAIDSI